MAKKPKTPPDPWRAPSWLDTAGKREWRRVVDLLADRGGLDELRLESLSRYAAAWSLFAKSTAALPGCTAAEADVLGAALSRSGRMLRNAAADLGIPIPEVDRAPRSNGSVERREPAGWFNCAAPPPVPAPKRPRSKTAKAAAGPTAPPVKH